MAVRVPVLALALAAGPVLSRWLLRRTGEEGRKQYLRFLTASYRTENEGWEA